MKRVLIGCGIIKKELLNVLDKKQDNIETIWMDEDLHNHPEKLNVELQKTIDSLIVYDEVLLSYGLCGNALVGITATNCDLLYPATDDCINALMCDNCNLAQLRKDSIFVSRGWLTTKNGFTSEYQRAVDKYGEERAELIYQTLYEHYNNVVYMKTEEIVEEEMHAAARKMADQLELNLLYEPAGIRIYEKLLTCKEDNVEIKRLKKGETIQYADFTKS